MWFLYAVHGGKERKGMEGGKVGRWEGGVALGGLAELSVVGCGRNEVD